MPVIGTTPTVIPTFTNTWNPTMAATPLATSVPQRSRAVGRFSRMGGIAPMPLVMTTKIAPSL